MTAISEFLPIHEHLRRQLEFVLEIDRLKQVSRKTHLLDGTRPENSAEHSWHIAVMAILLAGHAGEHLNLERVLKMLLIHDIVELDSGDSFCYDEKALQSQAEREDTAARRLFGLLPEEQGNSLFEIWREFEGQVTPEAIFAATVDRLQPLLFDCMSGGGTLRSPETTMQKVIGRHQIINAGSPLLASYANHLIRTAASKGFIGTRSKGEDPETLD
jgi:putative hydrolase of HD superfamily